MRRAAVAVALAAALGSAGAARARVVEKIAAVVGENIILQSEVEERLDPFRGEIAAMPNPAQREARMGALRREILDRLIDEELIHQQAVELKLSITAEEVDRSIEQIKKENTLTDVRLIEELTKMGQTMSSYRADIKKTLLRYKVLNIAVGSRVRISDNDIQSYYDRNMKAGTNVQVRASHVFVAIPENADTAMVVEKEKVARKLLERAQAGEDFAKLAREHSEDPATRADGGDFGFFGRGMLPKPIEEMVFSMRVGEVRGPVRAERGFHVIKVVDRKAQDVKPLADIKEQIRAQLHQKEMERQTKSFLAELRKKTLVELRL